MIFTVGKCRGVVEQADDLRGRIHGVLFVEPKAMNAKRTRADELAPYGVVIDYLV